LIYRVQVETIGPMAQTIVVYIPVRAPMRMMVGARHMERFITTEKAQRRMYVVFAEVARLIRDDCMSWETQLVV
jgi:hypothetical protein